MKKCPSCWEDIQSWAKKCRYCHERIQDWTSTNTQDSSNQSKKHKIEKNLLIISCVMLGIAIIWFGWYEFYILNRIVIFVIMLILFVKNYKYRQKNEKKMWIYGITAFIYNPIFSIYLTRPIRTIIDIVLITIFIQIIRQNKIIYKNI